MIKCKKFGRLGRRKKKNLHSSESTKSMFDTMEGKVPKKKLYTIKKQLAGAAFFQPEENDAGSFTGFLSRSF